MRAIKTAIRREVRVALSRHAQPVWFRIAKWVCIIICAVLFHNRRWFWWTLAGLVTAAILVHLLYRRKTNVWTRAWGGWKDVETGRR